MIGGSSHILETKITTFFRKMKHGFPYVEPMLIRKIKCTSSDFEKYGSSHTLSVTIKSQSLQQLKSLDLIVVSFDHNGT
ncbi:hypothetical protein A6J42_20900 [Leptospira interrogans serovar Copenhageni]|nr:hypothetical protein A6J42_20900 [Leptospira interrogans serovar Copenhageni]